MIVIGLLGGLFVFALWKIWSGTMAREEIEGELEDYVIDKIKGGEDE